MSCEIIAAVESHVRENNVTRGFNITQVANRKKYEKFTRLLNIRIIANRDCEEIENIITEYIVRIRDND